MSVGYAIDGRARRAPLWIPPQFDHSGSWPLLVFLHGYEERGDANEHLTVGIGPALEDRPDLYPCLVLLPQCPRDRVWSAVDRPWAEGFAGASDHIDAAIDAALREYPIDSRRIALTGASMGGYGTFVYGASRADRFRALGPVCGGGTRESAIQLANSRVFVVHGMADDVVPLSESSAMVDRVRAAGGRGELRTDFVAGAGHDIWDRAYRDPQFVGFLLG